MERKFPSSGCYCHLARPTEFERIVGSYKTISVEGRFKVQNLLGPKPKTMPVPVVRAVIDLDVVRGPTEGPTSDDLAELN